tara:strand:- start:960 stop:1097 length:138 start_codon:yes stop_codon:yes gene_type:complete
MSTTAMPANGDTITDRRKYPNPERPRRLANQPAKIDKTNQPAINE